MSLLWVRILPRYPAESVHTQWTRMPGCLWPLTRRASLAGESEKADPQWAALRRPGRASPTSRAYKDRRFALSTLKRHFYFPMYDEDNVRTGFLEDDHYQALHDALPLT
jgi:hypothetical protein